MRSTRRHLRIPRLLSLVATLARKALPRVRPSVSRDRVAFGTGLGVFTAGVAIFAISAFSPAERIAVHYLPGGGGPAAPDPAPNVAALAMNIADPEPSPMATPTSTPAPEPTPDPRPGLVAAFLAGFPLEPYAATMVEAADANGVDWRLIPVIAFLESGAGQEACGYNPFGYASCAVLFGSYEEAIWTVAETLAAEPYAGESSETRLCIWVSGEGCHNALALWYVNQAAALYAELQGTLNPPAPWHSTRAAAIEEWSGGTASVDIDATPTPEASPTESAEGADGAAAASPTVTPTPTPEATPTPEDPGPRPWPTPTPTPAAAQPPADGDATPTATPSAIPEATATPTPLPPTPSPGVHAADGG